VRVRFSRFQPFGFTQGEIRLADFADFAVFADLSELFSRLFSRSRK